MMTVRVLPVGKRRLAKIERQRTQTLGSVKREMFRVSGRPDLATPSVWRNAEMFGISVGDDK
jgi:hypothetical protein